MKFKEKDEVRVLARNAARVEVGDIGIVESVDYGVAGRAMYKVIFPDGNTWYFNDEHLELADPIKSGDILELSNQWGFVVGVGDRLAVMYKRENESPFDGWDWLENVRPKNVRQGFDSDSSAWMLEPSKSEILRTIHSDEKVSLNNKYTAVVKDNMVEVGCQSISFDKVIELYEAVKRKIEDGD